ncbi:hypothetical protein RhiirA1_476712 [Rhizophagus irregularis]|uniref:Uncharacterized protein n=1 Tax=Rhizophagus irregularis TaxID=588596 RepID=A0A2N0QUL6_9GLOM|nr:hypothetical protein RhiirA1_476712 [Rhizophagus irregularis]
MVGSIWVVLLRNHALCILVGWFPTSWTLRERKQHEKFQAVIHDIPKDMMTATLWIDHKPEFLTKCGANLFKLFRQKAQSKPKAKNTLNKNKSGKTVEESGVQKKAKNSSKNKGRNKDNKEVE